MVTAGTPESFIINMRNELRHEILLMETLVEIETARTGQKREQRNWCRKRQKERGK